MPLRLGRWHIEYHRRAIHITREPDPNCPYCPGTGGAWVTTWSGPDWEECQCLSQLRFWRIPLWRHRAADSSMEAPF